MKKKIVIVVSIVLMILIGGILYWYFSRKNVDEPKTVSDALKFKEEYESLNNTIRKSDGATYNSIKIDEENPIKYIDSNEAVDVLKKDNAIIYIGAGWCPWCRNAVPVLFEVAQKYEINTIYYLNLDDEKSTFEINNGKLVKTKEGSEGYYKLLDVLKDHLKDYKLTDKDKKEYDTKEKRIYMPYVIGIKNGQIKSEHVGTVTLNKNQTKYDSLTEDQHQELTKIYEELVQKAYSDNSNVCSSNGDCN